MRPSLASFFLLFLLALNPLRADDQWGSTSTTQERPPQNDYIEKRLKFRDTSFRAVATDTTGMLKMTFEVPRVVAMRRAPVDQEVPDPAHPVQDDQGLLLPDTRDYLVNNSLLSATATIRIYLKYESSNPKDNGKTFQINKIYLNGELIDSAVRTAQIGSWRPLPITLKNIPIEKLRFGKWNGDSSAPTPGQNDIEINSNMQKYITPLPNGDEFCEVIPIGLVEFGAAAPILMVHGLSCNADKWMEPATLSWWDGKWGQWNSQYECFLDYFLGFRTWDKDKVGKNGVTAPSTDSATPYLAPWSNRISLGKTILPGVPGGMNGIIADAGELRDAMFRILASFGAKKTHLVAHSKGGLDSRAYLNSESYKQSRKAGELEVLTLFTLATPHHGSVLAPILLTGRRGYSDDPHIQALFDNAPAKKVYPATLGIKTKGVEDLVPSAVNSIVGQDLPPTRHFYNLAADADIFDSNGAPNPDGRIQVIEGYGQLDADSSPSLSESRIGNAQYWLLQNVAEVNIETTYVGVRKKVTIRSRNGAIQPNDFLVTRNSALLSTSSANLLKGTPLIKANHGTAKQKLDAGWIVEQIVKDFPVQDYRTEQESYD